MKNSRISACSLIVLAGVVLAIFLVVFPVWAKTWYVHPAGTGPTGEDHISGFANINWAVVAPGDTLLLDDNYGTYSEHLQIWGAGTSDLPVTLTAATGETPVIQGSVAFDYASYVEISGLTITNSPYAGVLLRNSSYHITVSDCVIKNNYGGVWIGEAAGANNTIADNQVFNNTTHGIAVDYVNCTLGNETIIAGNQVYANKYHGIEISGNYYIIEENTVYGNGGGVVGTSGIHLYARSLEDDTGDHNIIRYNVSYNNKLKYGLDGNGIQLDQFCDYNEVYYNLCYNNDGAGIAVFDSANDLIYNNTLYGNCVNPLQRFKAELYLASNQNGGWDHVQNVTVVNNIIVANKSNRYAIYVDIFTYNNNNVIGNNCFYQTRGSNFYYWGTSGGKNIATWNTLAAGGGDDLYSNPNFVSSSPNQVNDFKLKSNSVCLNKATNLGQTRDILGVLPFPKGTGPDLGTLESY